MIPLHPLVPLMHADYSRVISPAGRDPLPAEIRSATDALVERRNSAGEDAIDAIDREIAALTSWYAVRPDDIARRTLDHHGWSRRHPLSIEQATVVLAAIGEAGYPVAGNGAPEYSDPIQHSERWAEWHPPVRGEERDRVVWSAARYWARMASRRNIYVSLGDSRGFMPRAVQYDEPGSMNPSQQAALTLGPAACADSHAYMSRHTRLLLRVAAAGTE